MLHLLRARRLPLLSPALRLQPASTQSASATAQPHDRPAAAHVTAPVFAGLLRKTGLSTKKLHALDALAQQERRAGHDAFPLAVALSGGADSMALTLLLRDHLKRQHIQTPLLAITVDHGLRPESAQEAHDVGQMVTTKWGVEHVIAQCEWADSSDASAPSLGDTTAGTASKPAKPRSSKLQEEARRHRYALLERVCREKRVQFLFVAHNLGDQLETMLFRLGRASGVNGLAGIASVAPLVTESSSGSGSHDASVTLVRPLLSVRKAQLKATCARFGQAWVEDPSNDKLLFDRIRIRKELERLEAREDGPELLQLFSDVQQHAVRAKRAFVRLERQMLRQYIVSHEPERVVLSMALFRDAAMFDELSARIVSDIVVAVGNKRTPPRLASVERLVRDLQHLESGKTLTLAGCRITKKSKGKHVHFEPERAR